MASMGNSRGARGRAAAGAAVAALTAALGMAVGPVGPAGAAEAVVPGWTPRDHAFAELPAASTDGEITVTEVGVSDPTQRGMRSFRRDGTAVTYRDQLHFRDHQWSPGGDLVSGTVDPTTPAAVTDPGSTAEQLETKTLATPSLWSPLGDSLVHSAGSPSYQPVAQWLGSSRPDNLFQQSLAADPGTALPLPRGEGVLVSVPSRRRGQARPRPGPGRPGRLPGLPPHRREERPAPARGAPAPGLRRPRPALPRGRCGRHPGLRRQRRDRPLPVRRRGQRPRGRRVAG